MPFVRAIVSTRRNAAEAAAESIVNTLYFNVSTIGPDPTDYDALAEDLRALWSTKSWATGRFVDVRLYDMADAEPRPQKARKAAQAAGTPVQGVPQVALALSYYADRNLPRQRGRIFLGPWSTGSERPSDNQMSQVLNLAQQLADLGGANVDWSLWSPTTQQHTRISTAWCDDSWDIIRSRKLPQTKRSTLDIDG